MGKVSSSIKSRGREAVSSVFVDRGGLASFSSVNSCQQPSVLVCGVRVSFLVD